MSSDWLDTKEDLCNYLLDVDSGNFAVSGPVINARNPGLFVKESERSDFHSLIGMPQT